MRTSTLPSVALLGLLGAACAEPARSAATDQPWTPDTSGGPEGGPEAGVDTASPGADETGSDPGDLPSGGFLDGFFPIGVFSQPAYAIESWASIGCNTLLEVPVGEDIVAWDVEAQAQGMAMIRRPVGEPSDDAGRTDLLAWLLPDEPDVEANNGPCGGNCVDVVESMSSQWRQADPDRKIFVNVAGPNVLLSTACDHCNGPGDEPPSASCYPDNDQCYPRIFDAADWVSDDIYPITGWLPSDDLREDVTVVGRTLDRMRAWTDKPLFAILEVSDQRLGFDGTGTRGPTPDEYRAELWHAILHGARGVFYFPQAFNPFEFESVDPAVLDEMIAQHQRLAALAPLLQAEIDPADVGVTADAPLEVTWRRGEQDLWLFVLNTVDQPGIGRIVVEGASGEVRVDDESRTVMLQDGEMTDSFEPYELHVYVVRGV